MYATHPSGLIVPKEFVDTKQFLKEGLKKAVDKAVEDNQNIDGRYFLIFQSPYNRHAPQEINLVPTMSKSLPQFITNQIVFYVDNRRGFAEWLWTVTPQKQVQFNTKGVAYLQAKGAMPTKAESFD
jgi:hypothetical protein